MGELPIYTLRSLLRLIYENTKTDPIIFNLCFYITSFTY